MRNSGLLGSRAGMAVVAVAFVAPLLAGCASQPSAPTIFGARIVPSDAAGARSGVHLVAANGSALTIFGVPVAPAQHEAGGTALAAMP